jgi:drug/metabolite transporter (DMT)-like permease
MPDARRNHARDLGVLALAAIAPVWGYGWVVIKVALDYASPLSFIALATGSSAVCFFIVLVVLRRPLRPPPLRWTVPIGLLQTSLFNIFATVALSVGGAGKVSVLAYTMPFWLLLLAWLFLGERLHGLQWPAVALAFVGLVLVVRPWDIGGALGGILACAAGLAWGAGALLVKLLQRRVRIDALTLAAWQMAFGAAPLVVLAVLTQSGWPQWTATFLGSLAFVVLLSSGACWALWIYALHSLPAGAAGMGTLAVPVVGVTAAWIQLGERPGATEAAGMALIVAALAALAAYGVLGNHRFAGAAIQDGVVPPAIDCAIGTAACDPVSGQDECAPG